MEKLHVGYGALNQIQKKNEKDDFEKSIGRKSTCGSLDPYQKDNDASKALENQIEDPEQGLNQVVGESSHPLAGEQPGSQTQESTSGLGPDGTLAVCANSPKDMTTGEPPVANDPGINATLPLMSSAQDDHRQIKWEEQLPRFVVPSAASTKDDRVLVELKKRRNSIAYIATSVSRPQREPSANYRERPWHSVNAEDNLNEERKVEQNKKNVVVINHHQPSPARDDPRSSYYYRR